jgi:aspartate/methionine/tyrosine aminotransferase
LIKISEDPTRSTEALQLNDIVLDYNDPMKGGDRLRENLAGLYSARGLGVDKEDLLIANAGIDANHIVIASLVGPGDHVICHYPTYEQLYQLPKSLGAEVTLWKTEPSKKWQLDIDELKGMIKDNTKMIIVNNPHNPSGAIISRAKLEAIVDLAEQKGIYIMSDEAFRPLFHSILPSHEDFPPSAINLGYRKTVVTSTMSKAYGLPGIRVGWIASKDKEIIRLCYKMRLYTTTTVSQLDEAVACEALSDRCVHSILAKNIKNCQRNVESWQNFIDEHSWACQWVKPVAGTTGFIKFHKMGKPVDDEKFCVQVEEKAGVTVIPGSVCFGDRTDFKGHIRIGLGADPDKVKAGLSALSKFMEEEYESVATAAK